MRHSSAIQARLAWCQANLPRFQAGTDNKGKCCCELPGHEDRTPSALLVCCPQAVSSDPSAARTSCQWPLRPSPWLNSLS